MATSATITVVRKRNKKSVAFVRFYAHYDGYPDNVGLKLAQVLEKEGARSNDTGCLAATICKEFKDRAGGFYIEPMSDPADAEYNYIVTDVIDEGGLAPRRYFSVSLTNQGQHKEFHSVKAFLLFCQGEQRMRELTREIYA
jgi:hypothetical protein